MASVAVVALSETAGLEPGGYGVLDVGQAGKLAGDGLVQIIAAAQWSSSGPYPAGTVVVGGDANYYVTEGGADVGVNPVGDTTGAWTPVPTMAVPTETAVALPGPQPGQVIDEGPAPRPCGRWTDQIFGEPLPDEITDDTIQLALDVASELLWMNSGRRYGTCTVTVRPVEREWAQTLGILQWPWLTAYMASFNPFMWPRFWMLPMPCGMGCGAGCGHMSSHRADLRKSPVRSIERVLIDGQVLPPSAYRVDNFRYLVRLDGAQWPRRQRIDADDSQAGTWSVTFTYGRTPPRSGVLAAGVFARELALAIQGKKCSLPDRITTLSRQGVQAQMIPLNEYMNQGRTGIRLVDDFLIAVNRNGLSSRAKVYRADAGPRWARSGT